MNEANVELIAIFGLPSAWIAISITLLWFCIKNGKKSKNNFLKSIWYSIGITHLVSPSVIGAYVVFVPVPATFNLYGFLLSLAFGDFWIFDRSDAGVHLILSMVCLIVCFFVVWLVTAIAIWTKK